MVTFQLMPDGAARAIRLRSSAGSDLLDEEALALIARAQPLPVPDAGSGVMEVTVPVQFQLR